MELKLDVKTLIIGIAIGIIVTAAIGAGSSDESDFGIAIPSNTGEGSALVRTSDNSLFIVNARTAMAIKVLQAGVKSDPEDRRNSKNRPFSLNGRSETATKRK